MGPDGIYRDYSVDVFDDFFVFHEGKLSGGKIFLERVLMGFIADNMLWITEGF